MPGRDEKDASLELFVVLARAHRWVETHAIRDIRRYGLNSTEFGILELLYHKGPLPLQQIGEKILISSGNITYSVDKLEQKQLLARKPAPHDRRITFAEITEKGRQLLDEIFPQHEEAICRAVSGLTLDEKREAIRLLRKLGLAAQASYEQRA